MENPTQPSVVKKSIVWGTNILTLTFALVNTITTVRNHFRQFEENKILSSSFIAEGLDIEVAYKPSPQARHGYVENLIHNQETYVRKRVPENPAEWRKPISAEEKVAAISSNPFITLFLIIGINTAVTTALYRDKKEKEQPTEA